MIEIKPATTDTLDELLSMVAEYQTFYHAPSDSEKNRAYFSELLQNHRKGIQFVALKEGHCVGFATLYFPQSTLSATTSCLLNDLFVRPAARRSGTAKALIKVCADYAKRHGYPTLEWITQPTNNHARALYDSIGAKAQEWLHYTLGTVKPF